MVKTDLYDRSKILRTRIAVAKLGGVWPDSQECNGLLHYDWKRDEYYSDFYGTNEYVERICTKDEFIEVALRVIGEGRWQQSTK